MQFFLFFIAARMWWSNHKINNYLKRQLATEQKCRNDTSTVAAGWDHFKINKIKRRFRIADYKNTVWCHHLAYKTIAWQEFLLYLLSAMFSSSSDEELCAQCSTGSAVNLPTDAIRPRRHHESKAFRSGITDVLRLGEVNVGVCASWLQPSRQCEGAGRGKRVSGSHLVCLCFRRLVREGAPCCSGPSKTEPTWAKPNQRSRGLASPPDCLSGYLRVFWGGVTACYHTHSGGTRLWCHPGDSNLQDPLIRSR